MKHRIGAAFDAIFLICILFVLSGCSPASLQTALAGFPNAASAQSAHSLALSLSLDSTSYQPGQNLSIVIDEQNTLSRTNHVPGASRWPLKGLTLSICGTEYYPFGVLIARGYYTTSNIVKSAPLCFYNADMINHGCHVMPIGASSRYYDVAPSSDIISDTYSSTLGYLSLKCDLTVGGYWAKDSENDEYPAFHAFELGIYTVAAGDEWGALIILHFTVTQ
jgi:hypothetical protein